MKKVILMVAVALAALSCANKEAEKAEEAAPAPAAVEAPAPAAAEAPAQEETQAQKEASLIERAVELGHDVADEVEKNK